MTSRELHEIRAVQDLVDTTWTAKNLSTVLQAIVDRVALSLRADRVSLITFDETGQEVVSFMAGGPGRDRIVTTVTWHELQEGLSGWVLRERKPALSFRDVEDQRESAAVRERRIATDCGSIMVLPLQRSHVILGTMSIINRMDQRDFDPEDLELATLMANYCAILIENARYLLELEKARAQAEESNRAKGDFLAMMSHELRTPLTAIIGFSELLAETGLDGDQQPYVEAIASGGKSLLRIINDILDLSKIESGNLDLESLVFNPRSVVESVVTLLHAEAGRKGIRLGASITSRSAALVEGDEYRLRQILINLVSNAIKFTEKGSVDIRMASHLKDRDVVVLSFEVEDTGIGIPGDKLERLFQPFSQMDASIRRRFGGTGLGLSISRRLCERMGGTLDVTSVVNAGSIFSFSIPTRAVFHGPAPVQEPLPSGSGYKVLLVDDSPMNRLVIGTMLKKDGCTVVEAESGEKALAVLGQEAFDLCFMDLSMPGKDGLETTMDIRARGIQALNGSGPLPIVALTANALGQDPVTCMKAGMNDYVSKPCTLADLRSVMGRLAAMKPE